MSFKVKENLRIKEKYYYKTLPNGLKITVIPKQLPTAFAMLACDFGGADTEYMLDGVLQKLPAGTAHFLEHKMFENADGSDAFLEFDRFGGNANAFTSYENTCFYFSCTDNFYENLEILLKAVSSVHFDDLSVEKERKIIEREIMMYEDNPSSNLSQNLRKALYHSHPTLNAISGTVESISEITKETLFKAYCDFYSPKNLSLCVCGDVDKERVAEYALKYFDKEGAARPETVIKREPLTVVSEKIEKSSIVATPLFSLGIKCVPAEKDDIVSQRRAAAIRLAVSLTFGRASDFYCENYKLGLLSERFYAGHVQSKGSAHIIVSGSCNDPELLKDKAMTELKKRQTQFFTEEQFLREKKAAYAESLTLFDSGEDLTAATAVCAFLDYDEFDCIESLCDIGYDEAKQIFSQLDITNCALSVINNQERN